MKRFYTLFLSIFFLPAFIHAQIPDQFNYQAVARNNAGLLLGNQNISVRLSIRATTPSGTIKYSETRSLTTNALGLFTIAIGSDGASNLIGSLATIEWNSDKHYLQTEIDPSGGSNFINLGTSQLLSVPYAIQAKQATFAESIRFPLETVQSLNSPVGNFINMGFSNGFYGYSQNRDGILGESGVAGFAGVRGRNIEGIGTEGSSSNGTGVYGASQNGIGGLFRTINGVALKTEGEIQLLKTGQSAGKFLMTDNLGTANWQGGIAFSANNLGTNLNVPHATLITVPFNVIL